VPLHLSALLAAPAAVLLAAHGDATLRWSTVRWGRGGVVAASALFAAAVGRASPLLCVVAMTAIAAATWQLGREMHGAGEAPPPVWRRASVVVAVTAVACLATSALAILLIRARHDPWVNQGNPSTVAALVEVVARRQYAVAGLWPRQAPLWLQLGNVGLYADWQVALSLGPSIFPTPLRTAATVAFGLLGVVGSVGHRRDDRRSWRAIMLLFLAGSIGVALYLNLKAGPSYGHGILPEGAPREARERDYFFVLAWWAWGLWAGYGAVRLARSRGLPGAAGALVAALPLVLNWRAVDRGRLPEATLPRMTAEGLLRHVPRNAVLFVAGDNDTYPLWYAQRALGLRRDVVVITTPLLPAQWYRDELATRHGLTVRAASWRGRQATIAEIADSARGRGRPVAMSMAMPAVDRAVLGARWALGGPAFVRVEGGSAPPLGVDTNVARRWSSELARRTGGGDPSPATDGTARYMTQLLRCPARALRDARSGGSAVPSDSLAPLCNFR